jgi:hypothetical protein
MTDREPVEVTNLDRNGAPLLPWNRARDLLEADLPAPGVPVFLGTTRPDGRLHAAGIGALWLGGDMYFISGPGTRKSRNLATNPACTMSIRLADIDVVLEGEATRTTDPRLLAEAAARYRTGGWPAEVDGDGLTAPFCAPTAGPPPWHLYRFIFRTALGLAIAEPHGATRWRFDR